MRRGGCRTYVNCPHFTQFKYMYFTGMYLQYHFPRAVQVILSSQLINLIGRSLSYAVTMCTAATEEGSKQHEIEFLQPVPQSGQRCNIP